jgi:hypothetical protein
VLTGCEAKVRLVHDSVKVLHSSGKIKTRNAYGYVRDVVSNNVFFYNNSLSVGLRALTERLYYVKSKDGFVPCPKPTTSFTSLYTFRNQVLYHIASPSVWTNDEFVQSYTGPKRKRYQTAVDNLASGDVKRHYGFWKTFIKAEFYDGTEKQDPCPRLIQPRSYEYNVLIGKYLRPVEKDIYKAIDKVFGYHVVLKCDDPWTRATTIKKHWDAIPDCVFVGFDASRFDQHISAEALTYEHSWYLRLFGNDPELRKYLSWQIKNKGFANFQDGAVKYEVLGCRGSGDMNTALGNVIIMCAVSHHYLESLGVPYRFIDDGDDCGVFISRKHLKMLESLPVHHLKYGFEMTVEQPVYDLEMIEFCQSQPIHCGSGRYMMVRNIFKVLKQDALSITSRNYATFEDVMVATAVCGLALYEGMPILDSFYRSFLGLKCDKKKVARVLDDFYVGQRTWRTFASTKRDFAIDEVEARVSLWKAFGVLPDTQLIWEEEFRAQVYGQQAIKHTLFADSTSRIQLYLDN